MKSTLAVLVLCMVGLYLIAFVLVIKFVFGN